MTTDNFLSKVNALNGVYASKHLKALNCVRLH